METARRALVVVVVVLSLVAAACGDDAADTTVTTAGLEAPASSTTVPPPTTTTTRAPTTTTTTAPTTTTTLAPPAVAAWDGEGVFELSLDFDFEPSHMMTDRTFMSNAVRWMFEQMGITVTDGADAVLTFDLVGDALGASYQGVGWCLEGATMAATVTLSDPGHPPADVQKSFTVPPPPVIFASGCVTDPEMVTAYLDAFIPASLLAITDLWQGSAVPMLMAELTSDYEQRELWEQATAIAAFESIDDEAISKADTVAFLGAVIDLVEYLVERDLTVSQGADSAARHLLAAYAGVDHGVTTTEDVDLWREWLAGWS